MNIKLYRKALSMFSFTLLSLLSVYSQDVEKLNRQIRHRLETWKNPLPQFQNITKPKLDSVGILKDNGSILLKFAPGLSYYPFREESVSIFLSSLKKSLGRKYRNYSIDAVTNNFSLNQLIPNYYRKDTPVDPSRIPPTYNSKPVLVRRINEFEPSKGLSGNSVALWHSHGYYFEMNLDRWEWQRARLFGTVEDISIMGYVLPFLTKMLENAGANVFLPRERDTQMNEVIVDNDRSTGNSEVVLHLKNSAKILSEGFLLTDTLFPGYNPFKHGTSLQIYNDSAVYIPEITENGSYAVYVSYPLSTENSQSVRYIVSHTGGKTEFLVNQRIGGETWIYLGTFQFNSGKSISEGSVVVKGLTDNSGYIALDAIKFGGGMGNVARKPSPEIIKNQQSLNGNLSEKVTQNFSFKPDFDWKLSGKSRFMEASRYYLQYAGMPDSLVYSPNTNKNDYNDDYQSRGAWVNYLMGNPYPSSDKTKISGLGIPIDLSLGFHSDAGVTPNDSVIGTLAIYSTENGDGKFPDGTSRMASRDLSDIIQTQVVTDIRSIFDSNWTRRGLWDRPYSEARKPNAPAMLLELLSHQNLADQQYGLDPRFRFQVSRSVYKGILKYLAYVEKREYVVQPVSVNGFSIVPVSGKTIRLSWKPVIDSLEPTSKPDRYKIYKRKGDDGFDNGTIVNSSVADLELDKYNTIYSFKVTALNEGGESFDSEILAVGIVEGDTKPVLIVNGFDRISGPAWIDENNMSGVAWWHDRGVSYQSEISFVGDQYDFNRDSPWLDDDSPGWGASYGDMEGKVIPGNSFDYAYIHGSAILAAGRSFYSVSDEYFCSDNSNSLNYKTIDLIFGEEKATPLINDTAKIDFSIYTPALMQKIAQLTQAGTNIIMTGAYVGSDLSSSGDSTAIKFAGKYLHFSHRTGHAVKNGGVYSTDYAKPAFISDFSFNTSYSKEIYSVEAPDAIEPAGKGAISAFRYSETNASAGVLYTGTYKTLILGFPFETISSENERNLLMKQILNYFK
jgi:hypothetical protein